MARARLRSFPGCSSRRSRAMQPSIILAVLLSAGAAMSAAHASKLARNPDVEFGPTGTPPADGIALAQEGLTGAWYNPLTSGQGFEFVVDTSATPNGNAGLFGAWDTFDIAPSGGPEKQRWY